RIACGSGPSLRAATDGEPLQQLPVEPNVELLRPAHALDVVLILPLKSNLDQILAAYRKVVVNRDAASGAQREALALTTVRQDMQRDFESLQAWTGGRQSGGEPRDLPRHRKIPLDVNCGDGERIRNVVEADVGGLVTRQQRLRIEVESEQVADRVLVF